MRSLRLAAIAAAVLVPTLALAEPGAGMGPCKADLQSLCAGVQRGGGRIRDCMKEHRAQLSAACKVAIADRMLERGGQRQAGRTEQSHVSVVGGGNRAAIRQVPAQTGN
jgi:hypothetical protein